MAIGVGNGRVEADLHPTLMRPLVFPVAGGGILGDLCRCADEGADLVVQVEKIASMGQSLDMDNKGTVPSLKDLGSITSAVAEPGTETVARSSIGATSIRYPSPVSVLPSADGKSAHDWGR